MNAHQGMNAHQWMNDYGKIKWQPQLDNGKRLWKDYGILCDRTHTWGDCERMDTWGDNDGGFGPVLYRSKKRAERVAMRHQRKMKHKKMSSYRPTGENHERG